MRVLAKSRKGGFVIKEDKGKLYAYRGEEPVGNFIVRRKWSWKKFWWSNIITCGDISVKDEEQRKGVGTALVVLGLILCSKKFKKIVVRMDDLLLREFLKGFGAVPDWSPVEKRAGFFAKEPANLKFVFDKNQIKLLEEKKRELENDWDIWINS